MGARPSFFQADGTPFPDLRFTRKLSMPHLFIAGDLLPLDLTLKGKRREFKCSFVRCWHQDFQNHANFTIAENMLVPGLAIAYHLFNWKRN